MVLDELESHGYLLKDEQGRLVRTKDPDKLEDLKTENRSDLAKLAGILRNGKLGVIRPIFTGKI